MLLAVLAARKFYFEGQKFMIDGKEVYILAGEMHPSRIPYQYWEHRIQMSKAMGLNTISIYIFWNAHELDNGTFDFSTPQNNMSLFIELCEKNDMYVLVRPGPYVCAEWDFGGLPAYLFKEQHVYLRYSYYPEYVTAYRRYLTALAKHLVGQMYYNNGPILMLYIENEYGFWYAHDTAYLEDIKRVWVENGVTGPFFSADPSYVVSNDIRVAGAAIGLNGQAGDGDFYKAYDTDPTVPAIVTEIYPGWFRHWGEWDDWAPTDITWNINDYVNKGRSFIFYVVHGGTSFGLTSGSNWMDNLFSPDLTSYDYGSPISENGKVSFNYMEYRNIIYQLYDYPLMDIPEPIPTMQVPNMRFYRVAGWFDQKFFVEEETIRPLHFEYYRQNYGLGIYSATLPVGSSGKLKFSQLADYVQIYLNGEFITNFTRKYTNDFSFDLPEVKAPGKLEVVVEAMGHINFDPKMEDDRKGMYDTVTFNGQPVSGWTLRRLPLENLTEVLVEKDEQDYRHGGIFKAEIELKEAKDMYIDFTNYYKGYIYVNGHNLGRYWSIGPQYRLFCPGVWLNQGKNTIYIMDLEYQEPASATGFELVKGCPEGQELKSGYCY